MPDVPDAVTASAPAMIASAPEPAAPPPAEPAAGAPAEPAASPLPEPPVPAPLGPVQAALYAGWTMAVLYGTIQAPAGRVTALPSSRELPPDDRRRLELSRLNHLLQQVSYLPEISQASLPAGIPADFADDNALRQSLVTLNLSILGALTAAPPEIQLAYELGRSLRDTANPPLEIASADAAAAPAVGTQLGRDRVAKLQEWLATLSCQLPKHSAAVVATSLGRWSEFAAVTAAESAARAEGSAGNAHPLAAELCEHLLPQGDVWLMLLTGERTAAGLLSPEAYVAAGEAALGRSGAIVRKVLMHYRAAGFVMAAALAGILYLTISSLAGAAQVWTSIAAIAGCVGISLTTVASTMSRLAAEAEQPVFAMAEEDAMAWAITTLPVVTLNARATQRLRKAGIAPSSSLGRI